jgi:hypothetical protein
LKKNIKILLLIFLLILIGSVLYWQYYKKSIIKSTIENAVAKETDSLYFIHYDSSSIDEINGNASFYNIELQPDPLQKQLVQFDTTAAAPVYNIHIDEVKIQGANIAALLNNTAVEAAAIKIIHPVIYIINAEKKQKKVLAASDSLAIYKKLLGKYKTINAKEIIIDDGFLNFVNKKGEVRSSFKNIGLQLKNFSIDSTKNYKNIVSYFIKDILLKVKEIIINDDKKQVIFTDLEYNATKKQLRLKKLQQKNKQQKIVFDLNNIAISNIATDSFIIKQQLMADELVTDGGILTLYTNQNKNTGNSNDEIKMDNTYFDEARLNKIVIGNTSIVIFNMAKPASPAVKINNVQFSAANIKTLYSGASIKNLIASSNWLLSGGGFSYISAAKLYKINIGAFTINSAKSTMHINSISIIPQLSEAAFVKTLTSQQDIYTINFKNIDVSGINNKLLITDKRIEADKVSLEPGIKIFNDRTVKPNLLSKVGNYPHQFLQKINLEMNIKELIIKNGYVAYKEKAAVTKQTGTVFFKNIDANISNVTNEKSFISKNNILALNATALFMGVSKLKTIWKLPLNTTNGAFNVTGTTDSFNATSLNTVTVPLGMVSIREGKFNKIIFDITGNDHVAKGSSTFLYENLKIDVLKKDTDSIKKKKLQTLVANILIKDKNPQNGEIRKNEIYQQRDVTKSFFFLLWKGILGAAKKTITGKNTDF